MVRQLPKSTYRQWCILGKGCWIFELQCEHQFNISYKIPTINTHIHILMCRTADHSLSKVSSAVQVVEVIILRARFWLRARWFGSKKSVPWPLLSLLSLTVSESDQGIQFLPLLHFLLRGQRTRRARFKAH